MSRLPLLALVGALLSASPGIAKPRTPKVAAVNPAALRAEANKLYKQNNFEAACELLLRAAGAKPKDWRGWLEVAQCRDKASKASGLPPTEVERDDTTDLYLRAVHFASPKDRLVVYRALYTDHRFDLASDEHAPAGCGVVGASKEEACGEHTAVCLHRTSGLGYQGSGVRQIAEVRACDLSNRVPKDLQARHDAINAAMPGQTPCSEITDGRICGWDAASELVTEGDDGEPTLTCCEEHRHGCFLILADPCRKRVVVACHASGEPREKATFKELAMPGALKAE